MPNPLRLFLRALTIALVALAPGCGPPPVLPFAIGTFTDAEINEHLEPDADRVAPPIRVSDTAAIEALVVSLNTGARATAAHRCPIIVSIRLLRTGKDAIEIGFMPGHEGSDQIDFYTQGVYYQADLASVITALRGVGVDVSRWER